MAGLIEARQSVQELLFPARARRSPSIKSLTSRPFPLLLARAFQEESERMEDKIVKADGLLCDNFLSHYIRTVQVGWLKIGLNIL